MARRFGIPIYFYGAAALRPERVRREDVRRGGFATNERSAVAPAGLGFLIAIVPRAGARKE